MGTTVFQGPGTPFPPELLEVYNLVPQGLSAEMIAEMWHITREQADEFAARSQRRAGEAQANGWFDREIAPVVVGANGDGRVISQDQGIRPDTTCESLASLQPAFKPDGIMHAGNSSQITDGAAAVLLMSLERANALGITPRARIAGQTVVGVDPVTMLTGPIPATTRLLERSGLERSTTSTSSRSTRPSRRWCWRGSTSTTRTWSASTSMAARSRSVTRSAPAGRGS